MLENECKKFHKAKEKFESGLHNEWKLLIEFENKLIKLKDEFSWKEVQISEMEFRINNLHQNQDVLVLVNWSSSKKFMDELESQLAM